ncbi:MAG TPA: acyclic terpene utilization AtuA family protein [Burkholderiaceae bacterium]|nr:acyclic terpene utilization AtuA family protein [Burkholderiaceae bacterium]
MNECRFVAASGMLGNGIHEDSLRSAMALRPHFVAADAGSTDAGPFALGQGIGAFPREAIFRDLVAILRQTLPAKVPVLIGSVGTGGADVHVDAFMNIVREVAAELGLPLCVAQIRSEQCKDDLVGMLRAGRIRALDPAPAIDEGVLQRSVRIVGMMGVEPLQDALRLGVDLIVAGRCSDPALYAAMPIMMGLPEGLAWHAGKVVECGTAVCERAGPGVIVGHVRPHEVIIQALGPERRCTAQSVAAHSLYENSDPFLFTECSGRLDIREAVYEQVDHTSVRIRGSRFTHAPEYTVKLEGAELTGFQTILVGGVRDPFILAQFDEWLGHVRDYVLGAVERVFGKPLQALGCRIDYHVYGRDGVMGALEPERSHVPHEVGIVVEATAPDQATATKLAQLTRQPLLHCPIDKWKGAITGFACLHNPAHIERGAVYQFNLHHVALPSSPTSMFRMSTTNIEGA